MTVTIAKGFDIKINNGTTSKQFRLFGEDGIKAWTVEELAPNPNIFSELQAAEGLPPTIDLPFIMNDWSLGVGVDRFGPNFAQPGHVLRYADGHGIDTTEPGLIKHGPLAAAVGDVDLAVIRYVLFLNKVWIITSESLYDWDGTTLTLRWDADGSGIVIRDMESFGSNLILTTDESDVYRTTEGTTFPPPTTAIGITGTQTASKIFTKQGTDNPVLIMALAGNTFTTIADPAGTPIFQDPITVGDGAPITNFFALAGLLFVCTEDTIYTIDSDDKVIEFNRILRTRRSSSAFTIKAESGNEVWLSDGSSDIFRIVARGFDEFDVQPEGPQFSRNERPVKFDSLSGNTLAMTMDLDAVYVAKQSGSDTIIYKGVEIARDFFTWTPLIKRTGDVINEMGIFKMTGDAQPLLYVDEDTTSSNSIVTYVLKNWTTYVASWELETSFFNARLEAFNKLWHTISIFSEMDANTKVTVEFRTSPDNAYATINVNGELTTSGHDSLSHNGIIAAKTVQLRFTGSTTNSANNVNMRSFNFEGLLQPPFRRIIRGTLIVENKTDADFLDALRTDNGTLTITDPFGVSFTVFSIPGSQKERIIIDEARSISLRAYDVVFREFQTAIP